MSFCVHDKILVHIHLPLGIYQLVCICSCASISLCVWVCVVSMVAGQPWLQLTHPYKAGREPSFLLVNLAPPPVLVGGVQHLDDVTGFKRQLPVRHGHMVPYRLSVDDWTSTYQLEKLEEKKSAISYAAAVETQLKQLGQHCRRWPLHVDPRDLKKSISIKFESDCNSVLSLILASICVNPCC